MVPLAADNRGDGLAVLIVQMLFLSSSENLPLADRALSTWPRLLTRAPNASSAGGHLPVVAPRVHTLHQPPASGETAGSPTPGRAATVPPQPRPSHGKTHGPLWEPLAAKLRSLYFGNFPQNLVATWEGHQERTSSTQTPLIGDNLQWFAGGNHVRASLGLISPELLSKDKAPEGTSSTPKTPDPKWLLWMRSDLHKHAFSEC